MWKHVAYLKKGLSHEAAGTNCQDSVLVREDEYCVVAALADGLGSLKHSEVAANLATELVWELFSSLKNERIALSTEEEKRAFARQFVKEITDKIKERADGMGILPENMDCTLVFVYISKRHHYAIVGRLGDSAVCVIKEGQAVAINDGNRSANGTSAIFDGDAWEDLDISELDIDAEKVHGFILTSDGLDDELYLKGSAHVNKVAETYFNAVALNPDPQKVIRERIEELTADADSPFDDDISIAVISRAERAVTLPADPTWLCSCGARNRLQDTYCSKCGKDFSQLYQNVRFKEHGGKTAFFVQINQHPDKEQQILGITPDPAETEELLGVEPNVQRPHTYQSPAYRPVGPKGTHSFSQPNPAGTYGMPERSAAMPVPKQETVGGEGKGPGRDRPQKPSRGSAPVLPVVCALCLVAGVIAGMLIVRASMSGKVKKLTETVGALTEKIQVLEQERDEKQASAETQPKETQPKETQPKETQPKETQPKETQPKETQPEETLPSIGLPDGFVQEEDGCRYWGEMKNGVPDGDGLRQEHGYYYIGHFKNGKKDGEFQVVLVSGSNRVKPVTVVYKNDVAVIDTDKMPGYRVRYSELNVRCGTSLSAEVITELEAGDTVYRTGNHPVSSDGKEWVEVIAEDLVGWVVLEAIEQDGEEASPQDHG